MWTDLGIARRRLAAHIVFRLFDDKALRMRAITVMMSVGMSGSVVGPMLGGTALGLQASPSATPVRLRSCLGSFPGPMPLLDRISKILASGGVVGRDLPRRGPDRPPERRQLVF